MIKTRYNRYVAITAIIGFIGGFVIQVRYGSPPLFALLAPWVISAAVLLLTRCPQCGVIYGKTKSGFYGLPKECRECGYKYL